MLLAGDIHGRKFDDLNANGMHDEGEPYLNGWTIVLFDEAGNLVESAVTMDMDLNNDGTIDPKKETGWYWFNDVFQGNFTVGEILKDGWRQTSPKAKATGRVEAGFDLFTTDAESTFIDLGPFIGFPVGTPLEVQLEGDPFGPGGFDTTIQRLSSADVFEIGQAATVEIELVALQLKSVDPVDLDGQQFDLSVIAGRNLGLPQDRGEMTIHRDHEFGGSYTAVFPVQAQLIFTNRVDPEKSFEASFFDFFFSESVWSTETTAGDPRIVDQELAEAFGAGGFFAGVDHPDICPGVPVLTLEQARLAAHGVLPAMIDDALAPGVHRVSLVRDGQVVEDVDFGNARCREQILPSSIHGYKFEDLNVNGKDDGEPRLARVEITLKGDIDGDGTEDLLSVRTDAEGEYWFEDLAAGTYTVSETPPAGSVATTPTSFTVTVSAGVELVALAGQAHLPPDDPRIEEVVGPRLAFGNAFEGSIHGFKFEDLDGDGLWDANEGPLGGVVIVIEWTDAAGNTQQQTTRTDANGEYWFEWLRPGLTYQVSEVAPAGMTQTTANPEPITIGSGQEYVARVEQGVAVQHRVSFPWLWEMEIVPAGQKPVDFLVEGMATFGFSDLVDVQTGETIPLVDAKDGLPTALPEGRTFEFQTEILSMDLSGIDPTTGHSVRVTGQGAGQGVVKNEGGVLIGGFGGEFNFDSFFDVDYQIEFSDGEGRTMVVSPKEPLRVGRTFTVEDNIRPTDVRWMPTILWRTDLDQELFDEAGQLWDTLIALHAIPQVEVEKPVRPVVDPRLAFGNQRPATVELTTDIFVTPLVMDSGSTSVDVMIVSISSDNNAQLLGWQTTLWILPDAGSTGTVGFHSSVEPSNYVFGSRKFYSEDLTVPEGMFAFDANLEGGRLLPPATVPPSPGLNILELDFSASLDASGSFGVFAVGGAGRSEWTDDALNARLYDNLDRTPDSHTRIGDILVMPQPLPGSIHGYKFEDLNADGKDDGEPRLAGVKITLSDANGILVAELPTDAEGEYWFEDLAAGTYTVSETPPAGSFATTPTSFTVMVSAGVELVALAGQAHLDPDDPRTEEVVGPRLAFGNAFEGSIHGFKFEDLDGDGLYEPAEGDVPFAGISFELTGTDGMGGAVGPITVRTDDEGEFWYTQLKPGDYEVREMLELLPDDVRPTTPSEFHVSVQSRQEYVWRNGAAMLEANAPQHEVIVGTELMFGNFREPPNLPGSIHGFKFEDLDANGIYDQGVDVPFAQIPFELTGTDHDGNPIGPLTVSTNAEGEFWFVNLRPGEYRVREVVEALHPAIMPSTPIEFRATIVSGEEFVWRDGAAMLDPDDPQHEVLVGSGLMFGNFVKGSVHGFKFHDFDGDGVYEPQTGEHPRVGIPFELTGTDGMGNAVGPLTVTTNDQGEFWYVNLTPGQYTLTEIVPRSFLPTTPPVVNFPLKSREELVWQDGAAMLPPNDPRTEVNVGGSLMFGNKLLGDLNGDGFVAFQDLTLLLAKYNQFVSFAEGNLVDPDTTPINFNDLTVLLAVWTGPGPAGSPPAPAVHVATGTPIATMQKTESEPNHTATSDHFDRIGGRNDVTLRRAGRRSVLNISRVNPLRRLQAAAVDRAMAEQSTPDRVKMVRRRAGSSGRL